MLYSCLCTVTLTNAFRTGFDPQVSLSALKPYANPVLHREVDFVTDYGAIQYQILPEVTNDDALPNNLKT